MDDKAESPPAADDGTGRIGDFHIARGGPFNNLQRRLGLLRDRALHAGPRAAIVVTLAWGVPLLLSALMGQAIGPASARPFLLDLGVWARFFLAIGVFVMMERMVVERLRIHLDQFVRAPLLAPGAMPAAAEAVARALRRRNAWPGFCCCAGSGGMPYGACCCAIWRGSSCVWSRPIPMAPAAWRSSAGTPTRLPPSCLR